MTPASQPASAAWPNPNAKVKTTDSGHPEVLFTFDDGPDHKSTGKVLDILAERDIQAVFYANGYLVSRRSRNRPKRVKILKRIVSDGHLVGNHTVNHAHLCAVSATKAAKEIDDNDALFEKLSEMPVFLFRAPYGDRCPRLEKMLKKRDMVHSHWDIDPREWKNSSTASTTAAVIKKLRRLKGRAVVLMHDTKTTTVRALPRILDWIEKENARREKKGKKTIRILGASEWVAQNWDIGLWTLGDELARAAAARLSDSVNRLVPGARSIASGVSDAPSNPRPVKQASAAP